MVSTSRLRRDSDNKEFKVACRSHWSEIIAEDGETDLVKWALGDPQKMVSADKGHMYTVIYGDEK